MKNIKFDDPFVKKTYDISFEYLYDKSQHITYIGQVYNKEKTIYSLKPIIQELKKKYNSYKSQDKKKNRYDEEQFITFDEMIFKLYNSKLKCYYCKCDTCLIYKNKNENQQWSLERFDNNIGHYNTNTCISCLKCNLQRRTDNHEYFKMGKELTLIKKR